MEIILFIVIAAFIGMLIAGATNKVVIYYDTLHLHNLNNLFWNWSTSLPCMTRVQGNLALQARQSSNHQSYNPSFELPEALESFDMSTYFLYISIFPEKIFDTPCLGDTIKLTETPFIPNFSKILLYA